MEREIKKIGDWFVTKEGGDWTIRRKVVYTDGTRSNLRYDAEQLSRYKSKEELDALVIRLNRRENRRAIEEIKTKLAFLPTETLEEFRALLGAEIPNQSDAKVQYHNLHRYFLRFFVDMLGLKDPVDWKASEHKWGMALLGETSGIYEDKKLRAVKTIKRIVQTANRLMAFLHRLRPQEVPAIRFEPISRARYKSYEAQIKLGVEEIGRFISPDDWKKIDEKLPADIAPFVRLGYLYGLRRAETLGIAPTDVRKGFLQVRRQYVKQAGGAPKYKPLKNKMNRDTPHWLGSADKAYDLAADGVTKLIHPDTLGVKFAEYMKTLGMTYEMHDLRRTFITTVLDYYTPKEVMLAVGHASIDVTMRYLRDDRQLDSAPFVPKPKIIEETKE